MIPDSNFVINENLPHILNDIKIKFNDVILKEHHQIGHYKAHGLSLYFPYKDSYYPYDSLYSSCNLDFTQDTNWDEFLELYYENDLYD